MLLRAATVAAICALPSIGFANTESNEADGSSSIDPKKVFSRNCSWCHNNYGLEAGKGPKLAGTSLSHKQVYDRIANGKSGAMPAYKKMLSADEIQALADYIKALPVD